MEDGDLPRAVCHEEDIIGLIKWSNFHVGVCFKIHCTSETSDVLFWLLDLFTVVSKLKSVLCGCPVFLIMMIGCWSSNAFFGYIRKQVKEFNHNVSQKMTTRMFHRHIPNYTSPTVSHLNPRQRKHPDNVET